MTDRPSALDLVALRQTIRTRDRVVAEIVRRAHAIGLPMTAEQARLAYDVTREKTARRAASSTRSTGPPQA